MLLRAENPFERVSHVRRVVKIFLQRNDLKRTLKGVFIAWISTKNHLCTLRGRSAKQRDKEIYNKLSLEFNKYSPYSNPYLTLEAELQYHTTVLTLKVRKIFKVPIWKLTP